MSSPSSPQGGKAISVCTTHLGQVYGHGVRVNETVSDLLNGGVGAGRKEACLQSGKAISGDATWKGVDYGRHCFGLPARSCRGVKKAYGIRRMSRCIVPVVCLIGRR
jgi:hypothetical protein